MQVSHWAGPLRAVPLPHVGGARLEVARYPVDGETVIARVNGQDLVMMEYRSGRGREWLQPSNPLQDRIYFDRNNVEIAGIVDKERTRHGRNKKSPAATGLQ